MSKYQYSVLNYWNDGDDLYVNYIVENTETKQKANAIEYYDTSDIECDYNTASEAEIEKALTTLLEENDGIEFKLPKASELSPLLRYIYDRVCESEDNMCHIDYNDWEELKEEEDFLEEDINVLEQEIEKYNLHDYITLDDGEYKICGYGGLQCFVNDDRVKESDELER